MEVLFKLKFTGSGGYQMEQEYAKKLLVVGSSYGVTSVEVGGWVTYLTLEGFEKTFNSCLFEDSDELQEAISSGAFNKYRLL